MDNYKKLQAQSKEIEKVIKFEFKDKNLLYLSFVHRSFVNEYKDIKEHNERLEFLGDAVLGLVVSEYLFKKLPSSSEGKLSSIRSHLVDTPSCAKFLKKLKIEKYVLLGRGEQQSKNRGRETILADVFEALIGAIFLDQGLMKSKKFLLEHFKEEFEETIKNPSINFKSEIQELSQKKFKSSPEYKLLKESGPDHDKQFEVAIFINEKELGIGIGPTKKLAEQQAAKEALSNIKKVRDL